VCAEDETLPTSLGPSSCEEDREPSTQVSSMLSVLLILYLFGGFSDEGKL
jgi:hypothetical protein